MPHQDGFDWNEAKIWNADGDDVELTPVEEIDGEINGPRYQVQVHNDIEEVATITGNLESALVHWILDQGADVVFGCFAWLTNYRVLDALAQLKYGCQVVVQKEDFLRPDKGHTSRSNGVLQEKYGRLRCLIPRFYMPSIAGDLSVGSDDTVEAVRCAGVANADRKNAAPRMHHKFAVACKCRFVEQKGPGWARVEEVKFHPYSVWTGSFNPTFNGTKSRENAVVINSDSVAKCYVEEWAKVLAMSEPLDWSKEWSAPEWRIGT